jgi:hypothetical protein
MTDTLDRQETRKDTIQVVIESGVTHASSIMGIVVGAVRDVTRELGDWATDVFEIRDAARAGTGRRPGPRRAPGPAPIALPAFGPSRIDRTARRKPGLPEQRTRLAAPSGPTPGFDTPVARRSCSRAGANEAP